MKKILTLVSVFTIALNAVAQRQTILINQDWKFGYGHALSFEGNYMNGTKYFNYLTKTGYGDGPADENFDDRAWRTVNLPHDWAVELPFSPNGSHSHGYKALGYKFPENSVGWYRKNIEIPQDDYGKKISIAFEGVFRNSDVWINGFFLGHEMSGYLGFEYDVTDYINYGGNNVITVKTDAVLEEGWFYEGAGIYRNVWLKKTNYLNIAPDGIFASSEISGNNAELTVRTNVRNQAGETKNFTITYKLSDDKGNVVKTEKLSQQKIDGITEKTVYKKIQANGIKLWSIENPNLYNLEITIEENGKPIDNQTIKIGFRTIEFTTDKGFFLNGKHTKIIGANIHQDFAGVGVAVEKPLQIARVKMLKNAGFNAIRTSHNPVNPELLDVCDSLGLLVLTETRLQGINDYHFSQLKRLIFRDRNHPSIIAWSIGNEEWQIESNIKGERITRTLQNYAKTLDSTRMYTVAISGGCGYGSSESIELMGFNYLAQCDIDNYRKNHINQPGWLTEETSGCGTRGIYIADSANCHMTQMDRAGGVSIERGYKFAMEREWMSGLFFWTGFDYRGEPTPFAYPAVVSQFGIMDLCGFWKDETWYININNSQQPKIHLFPHWNFNGHEGETIDVWAYTNCDEAELFLNKKSLGKISAPKYGHCSWKVPYKPGTLSVKAYKNGKLAAQDEIKTSGKAESIILTPDKTTFSKNQSDIILVTISTQDAKKINVPDANNKLEFEISGPAEIIGTGNGDPSSLENEVEISQSHPLKIKATKELTISDTINWKKETKDAKPSQWRDALVYDRNEKWYDYHDTILAIKAEFDIDNFDTKNTYTLFSKSILLNQNIYINGVEIASNIQRDAQQSFLIDNKILHKGKNEIIYIGQKIRKATRWDEPNTDPGCIGETIAAKQYKRSMFNGLALVILKTKPQQGEIKLTAKSQGLKTGELILR